MACNCTSQCSCGELTIPLGPRGFTGPAGQSPTLSLSATGLPNGTPPTVTQTGGPLNYQYLLGIPAGAPGPVGENATELFTTLSAAFTVPALNTTTVITVGDTSWMQPGAWLYIRGGGYFRISSVPSPTTVQVNNAGSNAFGVGVGWPTGVQGNAPAGDTVNVVTGALAAVQVIHAAVPGLPGTDGENGSTGPAGATGTAGVAAELLVTNTTPVAAPAAGRSSVIVTDSATAPTFTVIQTWNGSAWAQTANIQGAAGTQIVNTAGDPNVTLPAGPVGTYAVRTDIPSMYVKTGSTTWSSVVSLTPTFAQIATQSGGDLGNVPAYTQRIIGYIPRRVTHTAPGTYTLDLQYEGIEIDANQDIELDWSLTNYAENGQWTFAVENIDGSPINVTYASGRWRKATGVTPPATLAAGAIQVYQCVKVGSTMVITNTYVVTTV